MRSLSVILPVRNEERFVERTLRDLLAQDRAGMELDILVVDGQSTDQTAEIVRGMAERHGEIQFLENPKRLSSAARNLGIRHARGETILIVDGHCELPDRQILQNVLRAFEVSNADCLGRPQPLEVRGASPLQKAIAAARASRLGHHPESFIYADRPQYVPAKSVAVAYKREVFDRVGFFDETFDAHEDGEFNFRCDAAGLRCYFTPDIAVRYFPRNSLSGLYRQMVRYGKGRVRFSRKHSGTWSWGALIPALLVLYISLGAILATTVSVATVPYLTGLGVYGAVVAIFSVVAAMQARCPRLLPWLPVVFVVIHLGAGVGLLTELLVNRDFAAVSPSPMPDQDQTDSQTCPSAADVSTTLDVCDKNR